eukprot:4448947-Pyramimonas_sp.AAC.1
MEVEFRQLKENRLSGGMVIPVPPASRSSQMTRTPIARSLLDDVPHGIRSRSEVMHRRVENADGDTGRVSESVSVPAPAKPFLESMRRAGTSGPGMDLLARREVSLAVKPHESLVGFFNECTVH